MEYYAVFTTQYELGCDIKNFDNKGDLMDYVNSQLKIEGRYLELIVSGRELKIVSKKVITEWQIDESK